MSVVGCQSSIVGLAEGIRRFRIEQKGLRENLEGVVRMVKPEERKKTYKPTLRIRVRRTVGFALGVSALALIDLRYHILPRITGKLRGGFQKKS